MYAAVVIFTVKVTVVSKNTKHMKRAFHLWKHDVIKKEVSSQ